MESFTGTNVKEWNVIKSKLENSQEHLGRCSKNICRPLPQYVTISTTTGHITTVEDFSIVGREDQNLMRTLKEDIYIRVNNPSLNKHIGKYHLPHMCGEILFKQTRTQNKINHPG